MRRLVRIAVAFAIVGVLFAPTPAAAGGGNWIDFDDTYNVPGSEVTVSAPFWTKTPRDLRAHAPYYVYLERSEVPAYGWFLPKVDSAGVHRLAKVELWWPGAPDNTGQHTGHMRATFTLPELAPGRYLMSICNLDCSHTPGGQIGGPDVTGGFWVVTSPAEARARESLDALKQRFATFRGNEERRDRRALKTYLAQIKDLRADGERVRTELTPALVAAEGLRHDLSAVRDELSSTRVQRDIALGALVLLAVALYAHSWWSRRRRDSELEALFQDVGEGGGGDLFELVGSPDRGLLDVADLPEVDRGRDEDHVGV
jgi:hypothetical protein